MTEVTARHGRKITKEIPRNKHAFPALLLLLPPNKQGGAHWRAEIIPYEPDAVSTAEGIVTESNSSLPFAFPGNSLCFPNPFKYRLMKIYVNNKEHEVAEHIHVDALATQLELPGQGVALAVNNKMIPRTEWNATEIPAEAHVVIIKAACGG